MKRHPKQLHTEDAEVIARLKEEIIQLKQLEEKLIESEEFNRRLLSTIPDLVIRTNLEGIILFVNQPTVETLYNLSSDDLLGKNMLSFIDDGDMERAIANTQLMFEKPLGVQHYILKLHGEKRIHCEVNGDVIRDSSYNPIGMVYVVRDISERKKAEETLRDSEAFARTVMDNLPIGVAVNSANPEVDFEYMNDNFPRIYRTTREALEKKDAFWDAVYEDPVFREEIRERVLTDIASGNPEQMQWIDIPVTRKGKETRYVWAKNIQIPGKSLYISTVWDVTQLKKAEAELRESEERFRALHNASFGGIFIHDKMRIIACNQGLADMSGYTVEELIGMEGGQLIAEESLEVVKRNIETGYEQPYEAIALHRNGTTFPVQVEARNIPYKGKIVRVAEMRDISLQKKAEQELILAKEKAEASDHLKTAFINNISHEIRTPLHGILGFGQILAEEEATLEQRKEYLKKVQDSSRRLMQTIDDYIDISLLVSGNQETKPSSFATAPLLDAWYQYALELSQGKQIDIKVTNTDEPIIITTDRSHLDRVIRILIDNAVKFTQTGSIVIGCSRQEEGIEFFVQDTGIGIASEKMDDLFLTFWQEETANTRGHEGSGLGLAIAKGLTMLMGGQIWAESEKGKGSAFFVSIPLQAGIAPTFKDQLIPDAMPGREKPLVVVAEDDTLNFAYIEVVLEATGCDFLYAKNGKEAVTLCRENPDVTFVLMDIKMPVMNGLDATRQIKAFRPDLPVIALTAYAQTGDEQRILEAGCDLYLSKPIKPNTLSEIIKKYSGVL